MGNQVQGISRGYSGISPELATAMGTSLAQDPFGLSLDVPSRGFNVGVGAPTAIGAGRGTGQGFSTIGVPDSPVVGNVPGAASTTTANVAAQNAGNIPGVTTGPEMMGNIPGVTFGSMPAPAGYEENVGKPYSGYNLAAIENFYGKTKDNPPTSLDKLGLSKMPSTIAMIANFVENRARDHIAADLISGNYTAITDSKGNITGSRDSFGRVHSGMDMNAPDTNPSEGGDGNIIRPITPVAPVVEDPLDLTGSFGGSDRTLRSPGPVVVDSPFTSNVGNFTPVGYNNSDLNALIARLTGMPAPKSMNRGGVAGYANGGLISAVDKFLASAR
jgi:hypothetical protein